MDLTKYLKLFISESQEHLQKMDHLLLELEKSPQERSLVDQLFREAHSMKGMSASMGYVPISTLSHRLEGFLDRIRKGSLSVTKTVVDLLFEGFDLLRSSVEEVKEKGSALTDHLAFIGKLESFREEEAAVEVAAALPASAPAPPKPPATAPPLLDEEEDAIRQAQRWAMERDLRVYSITVQVARDSPMPNARALVTCKRVGGLGEILTVSPTLEELQGGHFSGSLSILLGTPKEGPEIQGAILAQPEIASVTVQDLTSREAAPPGREMAPPVSSAVPLQMRKSTMVRVDTRLLDDLVDMVGELVTVKGSLVDYLPRLSSLSLRDDIDRVDHLISGLYQLAIRLRMMPLDFVAERFPRAIRDLARLKGKEVTFEILGKEIELDRAILEELPDPLLHIFRNCIDHGVESPEERLKKGKPPQGRLAMEARRERERILITIRDDGKGMEPARIRRVALEKGIISREQLGSLTDEESLYLITAPGFSTAEVVSDVSGRGVGMDVVKSVIESLGGTLLIESKKDEGTAITLKLPLTLAIIQVLLVRVGEERYAVPLSQVYRTFEASPAEIQSSQGQEWIAGEEGLIPLLRLSSLLGISDGRGSGSKRPLVVILVDRRGRTTGMVVDQLLGYREAVVKPLRGILRKIKGFAGATIMGDGSLILILDLNTL